MIVQYHETTAYIRDGLTAISAIRSAAYAPDPINDLTPGERAQDYADVVLAHELHRLGYRLDDIASIRDRQWTGTDAL